MKLAVIGATGGIGSQVIRRALAAGHEVTAVARRPQAVTLQHERLVVVSGDVLKPESIRESMAGQDAVVSAVGARDRGPTTAYSEGVANLMQAMQTAHVRRFFCISSSGLEPGIWWQRLTAKLFLWRIFKYMYTDLVRMEQASIQFERYLKRRYRGSSASKHYLSDLRIFIRTVGNRRNVQKLISSENNVKRQPIQVVLASL